MSSAALKAFGPRLYVIKIEYIGDEETTSYNDIFDAFRFALKFYHYEERTY